MNIVRKIVVGISGASGAPYARRLLELLKPPFLNGELEVNVVLSRSAEEVWAHECEGSVRDFPYPVFEGRNYNAPFASGSARFDSMVVIPASVSCIARVAHGISDDLLTRAADVMLKERRRLILVARETPYSSTHLENMLSVTRAGALVLPASPSFYTRPVTLEEVLDTVLSRVLDHLDITNSLRARWAGAGTPRRQHSQVTVEDRDTRQVILPNDNRGDQ